MLHELMHTREMNHGDRFWSGLDALTGGRAKQLDKALNDYTTSIFPKK
jgi:predicted metal-dependent hydrolase